MIVLPNQSMADIAIMGAGTLESIFQLAIANGMSISDVPVPGSTYTIPIDVQRDTNAIQYLSQNSITVGTLGPLFSKGVGYWQLGVNFVVS